MRLSSLPFFAGMLIPAIASASESFVYSVGVPHAPPSASQTQEVEELQRGMPYVSPSGSQAREIEAQKQEELIRQIEPDAASNTDTQVARPPVNLQQQLSQEQQKEPTIAEYYKVLNKGNISLSEVNDVLQPSQAYQQQLSQEQQKEPTIAEYYKVLNKGNISLSQANKVLRSAHGYPPKFGSPYYDPNEDYSAESRFVPPNTR